jgi:hypothetical protein
MLIEFYEFAHTWSSAIGLGVVAIVRGTFCVVKSDALRCMISRAKHLNKEKPFS